MAKLRIDPAACLWWAVLLLVLPLKWLLAAAAAAAVHEMGHYLAVRLLGGRVLGITLGPGGAALETSPMEPDRELVCSIAGPVSGALTVFLIRRFPLAALCAMVQSLFNLLPIYPLDGGRVLLCAVELLFPKADAQRICCRVSNIFLWILALVSLTAALWLRLGAAAFFPFFLILGKKKTLQN